MRRAIGLPEPSCSRADTVALFPGPTPSRWTRWVRAAGRGGARRGATGRPPRPALALYAGDLLPPSRTRTGRSTTASACSCATASCCGLRPVRRAGRAGPDGRGGPRRADARPCCAGGDRAGVLRQFDGSERVLRRRARHRTERGGVRAARPRAGRRSSCPRTAVAAPRDAALATQRVRFCRTTDGVRLAYAVSGTGPPLVKAATG